MIEVFSTKAWHNLPCAHSQWFDKEPDGSPGECASLHGYDRSVRITFAGTPDEHGWIVPFGELGEVKRFIEYYFDHTSLLAADDERVDQIPISMLVPGQILGTLRVLPYGVSMEMSSLFVWINVNPYIKRITNGRCYVHKVEFYENDKNSAFIEVNSEVALSFQSNELILSPRWDKVNPSEIISTINSKGQS